MSNCTEASSFNIVVDAFCKSTKFTNILPIHIRSDLLKTSLKKSKEKRNIVRTFEKIVSGLRNTCGGFILVHLCNKPDTSLNLENFDETFENSLKSLIGDGSPFVKVYARNLICKEPGFEEHRNIVVVRIEKTSTVSSVVENTKVCSDLSIERPSPLELYGYIRKEDVKQLHKSPKIRGIDDPSILHEQRNIQLKTILPERVTSLSSGDDWAHQFAIHIWKDLRFQEYLSCMSKINDGGSYFLGINQERTGQPLSIDGFDLSHDKQDLLEIALFNLLNEIVILKPSGSFEICTKEENLICITYHTLTSGNVVLEISVRFVSGIVFYENGPKAYKCVQKDTGSHCIVEMGNEEWLNRLKMLCKKFENVTKASPLSLPQMLDVNMCS